jgi:hypothetical protein
MICREINLGESARQYVMSLLEDGLLLAKLVSVLAAKNFGRVFTVLPSDVDVSRILKLSSIEYKNNDIAKGGRVCGFRSVGKIMGELDRPLFVLENALARVGDPWLVHAKSRNLFFNQEVYHACSSCEASEIEAVFRDAASGWMIIGYLAANIHFDDRSELSRCDLLSLADHVEYIVVSAFDGDGYIFLQLLANSVEY